MYVHELKAYRKSTLIWSGSFVALIIFFMSMFPTFSKEADSFIILLEGFPEGVRNALGLSIENIASLLGFYAYLFLYIVLCGAIQAMNLGISILSKEVRDKTAEFLLTKPVTRTEIMTAKLLAGLTSLVITSIVYIIAALSMATIVKTEPFNIRVFLLISLSLFFIQLIFFSLGVCISVVVPKLKSVLSVSLGIVFAFFILSMFASAIEDEVLRYFTPFKYFEALEIIEKGTYDPIFILIMIIFVSVSIGASFVLYHKKDIHVR